MTPPGAGLFCSCCFLFYFKEKSVRALLVSLENYKNKMKR